MRDWELTERAMSRPQSSSEEKTCERFSYPSKKNTPRNVDVIGPFYMI